MRVFLACFVETACLFFTLPFFIVDHYLSFVKTYRRLRGGHWERQTIGAPCHGTIWVRMKREECYRMTGEHPGGIVRGKPYCEEKGGPAYPSALYCKCNRELTRAPGVHGSWEDETEEVFVYSCPCGRWPRFLYGPPVPLYLGDLRSVSNMDAA